MALPVSYLAFATDALGCVNVIRDGTVVQRFGNPNAERRIRSASFDDSSTNHPPVLAFSRIDGSIQLMNPTNGNEYYTSAPEENNERKSKTELHLFRRGPGSSRLLYCLPKRAIIATYNYVDGSFTRDNLWDPNVKEIGCTVIDNNEQYCVFAGKTNGNVRMWNIQNRTSAWNWKSEETRNASFQSNKKIPFTNMTAITFQGPDHTILVAGTNHSKIWTFDTRTNDNPNSIPINIAPGTPINALQMDNNGNIVYFATGSGLMGHVDTRYQGGDGVMRGAYFVEQPPISGSIKSIAKHPHRPLLASSGLDGYLRVWDINSQNRSSVVRIGHNLTSVFFSRL